MSGSSVVVVAFLLEGVTWYAAFRGARSVVELSGGRSGGESSSFLLIRRCRHFFFLLCFLFFSFGRACAASAPAPIVGCIDVVAL